MEKVEHYLFQYAPFGINLPLLKDYHLVSESWQVTPELGSPEFPVNQMCGQ